MSNSWHETPPLASRGRRALAGESCRAGLHAAVATADRSAAAARKAHEGGAARKAKANSRHGNLRDAVADEGLRLGSHDNFDLPGRSLSPRGQRDFFLADLLGVGLKADITSMEAPIYSLSTLKDLSIGHWVSQDGSRQVTVTPSVLGRATQHDKDVIIFLASQLTAAADSRRQDAHNRTVRFTAYDFLKATGKGKSGKEYKALKLSLGRLQGTMIKTNISTGGVVIDHSFQLIEEWTTIEKHDRNDTKVPVEVVLSEWLFNAIRSFEVLTLHADYFLLRRPLERRLYELARKHCGRQPSSQIGLDLLRKKAGSRATLKEFRRMVREIIWADSLPDYKLLLNSTNDVVTICTKDSRKLTRSILAKLTDAAPIVLSPTE